MKEEWEVRAGMSDGLWWDDKGNTYVITTTTNSDGTVTIPPWTPPPHGSPLPYFVPPDVTIKPLGLPLRETFERTRDRKVLADFAAWVIKYGTAISPRGGMESAHKVIDLYLSDKYDDDLLQRGEEIPEEEP